MHGILILTQIVENDRTSYWIVYFYQLIGAIFLAHTLVRLENYQIYCMICATAQIEILGTRIKQIGYDTFSDKTKHRKDSHDEAHLLECLKQHECLMGWVKFTCLVSEKVKSKRKICLRFKCITLSGNVTGCILSLQVFGLTIR